MEIREAVILVLIAIGVTGIVLDTFYGWLFRRLRSKYHVLQRLLLEQAELHEISLEAYTAMLREAQRHMDD